MTKSKRSIVTTGTTYLDIVTFTVIVIQSTISLLGLCMYLLTLFIHTEYPSRDISKNFIFTTSSEKIAITTCRLSMVTIPILYFVTIHSDISLSKLQIYDYTVLFLDKCIGCL